MQFERLRKNHKKKIIIGGLILVCVISAITITTTRAKYKLTEDIPLVKGNINYKSYDFKIMAMYKSDDKVNYTEINEIPSSGYIINEEKTYCTIDNKTQVKGKIKTVNGIHGLYNIAKNDKCYLYFDKYNPLLTMDNIIAGLTINSGTPNFANVATSDEGVYKVSDPVYGGYSYYWRGATTNNYVKFGGFCWRIVRINGDKTMRLIYDGATCHANGTKTAESIAVASTKYNTSSNQSNYVGWTYKGTSQRPTEANNDDLWAPTRTNDDLWEPTGDEVSSNAKTQLESWYSNNLASQAEKIANGKYCNDRNTTSGYTWTINGSPFHYATLARRENNMPTLACNSGDVYTLKVGLITVDEVIYAGGRGANNTSYYLCNGQNYWTASPSGWGGLPAARITNAWAYMFYVNTSGYIDNFNSVTSAYGLRPVINLKADAQFQTGGNGTLNSPYVVV